MAQERFHLRRDSDPVSSYKALRVVFSGATWPYASAQKKNVFETATGRLAVQIGAQRKRWGGTLIVRRSEESGFATLDDLALWMSSSARSDHMLTLLPLGSMIGTASISDSTLTFQPSAIGGPLRTGAPVSYSGSPAGLAVSAVVSQYVATLNMSASASNVLVVAGQPETKVVFVTPFEPQVRHPTPNSPVASVIIPFVLEQRQ